MKALHSVSYPLTINDLVEALRFAGYKVPAHANLGVYREGKFVKLEGPVHLFWQETQDVGGPPERKST